MRAEILRLHLCTDFFRQFRYRHPSSDPAYAGPPIKLWYDCHRQSLGFVTLRFATAAGGRLSVFSHKLQFSPVGRAFWIIEHLTNLPYRKIRKELPPSRPAANNSPPDTFLPSLQSGHSLRVPFRNRQTEGTRRVPSVCLWSLHHVDTMFQLNTLQHLAVQCSIS